MIKFDKSVKIELSGLLFWNIQFWQFQVQIKEGAKIKDLRIQGILRHGKGLRSIKELICKKSKPKAEAAKTEWSDFGFWRVRFSQNR
jgi:hypothetical protein